MAGRTSGNRHGCGSLAGLTLAVVLGIANPAHAQTAADAAAPTPQALKDLSLEELAELDVTSLSRRPVRLSAAASAVQVITSEDIRRSGATSLPEALRLAGNLDVARVNAHDWAISARGFNTFLANKLLVMIDGRTVYTPLFSGVFWERQDYPLADIERIEVVSGPGGTLWGANAVNGVINIVTKNAKDTRGALADLRAGTQLEDAGMARYGADLAPDVSYRVYGSWSNRASETRADGASNRDAWHKGQGGFRIDGAMSARDAWTLQGDAFSDDAGIATGGTSHTSGANVLGRWSRAFSDTSDANLQAYYDRTHFALPVPAFAFGNGPPLAPAGILTDDLDTADVDFDHHVRLGASHELIWGLGFRHTHDAVQNAPALAFLPTRLDQNLYSAFVQDEFAFAANAALTAGAKLEHNDYTGFEFEPSVRAQWSPGRDQILWAAISRAVRTPSRIDRDLFEPAPGAPAIVLEGSPDFRSESVVAHEIGYRAQPSRRFNMALSAFYNEYSDVRSTRLTPTTLIPIVFRNDLEGDTYGIEFSARYDVRDDWRLSATYTGLRENIRIRPGGSDFNAGKNETADPEQWFSLRSSFDLPHRVELDGALRWVASRPINNGPFVGTVPAYAELDLRVGWRASDRVELALAGQNLLHDRHPEYGFPGPLRPEIGRVVYAELVWRRP